MAAPRPVDRQTFLSHLLASGLVTRPQLDRLERSLPATSRGRVVARALVQRGVLTRFQAERLLAGRTSGFLLGQYRILEQIGRGGMGRVFKAEHRTMGRVVALKVLSADLLQADRAVELFLHEVRAVSQLVHPNIVTAYDANEIKGRYYLVLEYVDGPNLDELVRRQGPLAVGLACETIRQAAQGLECAHRLGMVHRDVKPANILMQCRGRDGVEPGLIKVSDFGLARLHTPGISPPRPGGSPSQTILTRENTVMGTPDYLSPEQCRDLHQTDIRSDLYALGCTFYYLLTGQVPFPGDSIMDKLIAHNSEKPAPIAHFRPDVPAEVLAVVARLMEKRPADRFQTPAELAGALGPYAVSGPTPWAPHRPSLPALDPLAPSSGELAAASAGLASSNELSALDVTVSVDSAPTPVAAPPCRPTRARRRLRHWAFVAVMVLTLLGGLGAGALLAMLLR